MGGDSPPVRSCQQCGATKTPQWREGPLGPKTLCNACGVKRVRMIKAQLEGRKPHNVSVGKRSTPQHTIHYAANREVGGQAVSGVGAGRGRKGNYSSMGVCEDGQQRPCCVAS
jgi:hypothetical protein